MNKKRLISLIVVLALVAALIPTVYAYMIHKSQTVANNFIPGKVTCDIEEKMVDSIKTEIKVKNTGNVDAYIRVRLVFRWEDSKGYPVARNMVPETVNCNDGWLKDEDEYTYYYIYRVAPGESTPNLLKVPFTMDAVKELVGGVNYYYYPVMEVLAEAIQADGKIGDKPAVTDAWGVIVSKDSEGNEYLSGFAAG